MDTYKSVLFKQKSEGSESEPQITIECYNGVIALLQDGTDLIHITANQENFDAFIKIIKEVSGLK